VTFHDHVSLECDATALPCPLSLISVLEELTMQNDECVFLFLLFYFGIILISIPEPRAPAAFFKLKFVI
jgi:hypothetical protein